MTTDTFARLFTSRRERRLWLWTLALVAGIYATLGLARTLAGALRDRDLIDGAFWVGILLVVAAIAALAWRARPGGAEIGVALGFAAVYLLGFLRMSVPEERSHLIEYGVVAVFILEALRERIARGRSVPRPALLAVGVTALVGLADEAIQLFLPARVFDPVDILFNFLAAVLAIGAAVALRWARRRRPVSAPPR